MAWVDVPLSDFDSGKPANGSRLKQIVGNFEGLANGDAGAPKIQEQALDPNIVGDIKASFGATFTSGTLLTLYENNTEETTSSTTPVKTDKFWVCTGNGTIDYSIDVRTGTSGRTVIAEIYKGDTVAITETTDNVTYETRTGSIPVAFGDAINVRIREDGGLSSDIFIRNFNLKADY